MFISTKNDTQLELVFASVAATNSLPEAIEMLKEHKLQATEKYLESLCKHHPVRLSETRNRLKAATEESLTSNLTNNALRASIATGVAVEKTQELLESGRCQDPSKTARDLADVVSKSIEKKSLLEGKPTSISENRNVDELLNALERTVPGIFVNSDAEEEGEVKALND